MTIQKRMTVLFLLALAAIAGCDDEDNTETDTPQDANQDNDNPNGSGDITPYTPPTPFAVALSATGPDQLQSVAAGPGGTLYAAGFAASTVDGPKAVVVVKLTTTGVDTSWGGGDGVVDTGLVFKGGSDEIEIAVQSTGKIVVAAVVAHEGEPKDTDVAVTRLLSDGTVDPDFGEDGTRVLNFNDAIVEGETVTGGDRVRGIALDSTDRIYLHGVQRGAEAERVDTDFVVARLTAEGALDDTFGTDGTYTLDIPGRTTASPDADVPTNATARGIYVLADGSVVAGGYATNTAMSTGPQAVLYKLTSVGAPDVAFASNGLFFDTVLSTQTEIYGFTTHGSHIVTGGYGRESGTANDFVSLRFDVTTGARDNTWGAATNGAVVIDPSGTGATDACRAAIALPAGKTLLIGSTGPSNDSGQNAVLAVLDAEGKLDTQYGTGIHLFTFGDTAGSEQFWGGAATATHAVVVGHRGAGATQTESANDDSYALILPIQP